jgi:hypothetical protein
MLRFVPEQRLRIGTIGYMLLGSCDAVSPLAECSSEASLYRVCRTMPSCCLVGTEAEVERGMIIKRTRVSQWNMVGLPALVDDGLVSGAGTVHNFGAHHTKTGLSCRHGRIGMGACGTVVDIPWHGCAAPLRVTRANSYR